MEIGTNIHYMLYIFFMVNLLPEEVTPSQQPRISPNIMKMMPNMRNGQLLRMNDQRGGFGSVVGSLTTPSFIHISEKEIRTNIGSTVTLNCRIQNIRNHTVSWVRTSDIEILSVGRYTYTFNQRIQLVYTNYLDAPNYGLRISFVQPEDSGQYECIINTRPETVQKVELFIVNDDMNRESKTNGVNDAKVFRHKSKDGSDRQYRLDHLPNAKRESASIVSGQMTYVQEGDLINITCIVEGGTRTEPPDQIFWYHKGEAISYFSERQGRGGVSVVMEKVALVGGPTRKNKSLNRAAASHSDNYSDRLRAVSHLLIRDASPDIDEGRYTCSPSDGTIEASTTLFVLEDYQ